MTARTAAHTTVHSSVEWAAAESDEPKARVTLSVALMRVLLAEHDASIAVLEAARAWAAVESETPQPSSTGVGDWAERRAAARDDLLAAVEAAR